MFRRAAELSRSGIASPSTSTRTSRVEGQGYKLVTDQTKDYVYLPTSCRQTLGNALSSFTTTATAMTLMMKNTNNLLFHCSIETQSICHQW